MGKAKESDITKPRKYSLNELEKSNMDDFRRIQKDLEIQIQGVGRMMDVLTVQVQMRVGIVHEQAPEGYRRELSYDPIKGVLIVTNVPEPKPQAQASGKN